MAKLKKGDRVSVKLKDGLYYGVVSQGGVNVKVVLDGGKREVAGGAQFFTLSDKPIPMDAPDLMSKYSVKKYKSLGVGRDGNMFTCEICMAGKPFATVQQGGDGGPNYYHTVKVEESYRTMLKDFKENAKEWAKLHGQPNVVEAEDLWVEWWISFRPYGQLAVDYLKF